MIRSIVMYHGWCTISDRGKSAKLIILVTNVNEDDRGVNIMVHNGEQRLSQFHIFGTIG